MPPVFALAFIFKFFGRQSILLQLALSLNIKQPGPEVLNQIISKRGHLPQALVLRTEP